MTGKIGVFLPGLHGDIMQAMSVLKYKDILWPDKGVVWFCNDDFNDVLKYNDAISEIRNWPHGWGLLQRCEEENRKLKPGEPLWADMRRLKDANNHLRQDLKHELELTKDLEQGYFPAPWMVETIEQRSGVDYPNFSRRVFGANFAWEWHPYLGFSDEEREAVKEFCSRLPHKKTIAIETDTSSLLSPLDDNLIRETMAMCRQKLGKCNFIFVCVSDNSKFFDDPGVVSCSQFTVRQTALVNNYSDLFIGVSSGISQAVNCWGNKPTPKLQYCGSFTGSSVSIANGPIELVVTDPPGSWPEHERKYPASRKHREVYKEKLSSILD